MLHLIIINCWNLLYLNYYILYCYIELKRFVSTLYANYQIRNNKWNSHIYSPRAERLYFSQRNCVFYPRHYPVNTIGYIYIYMVCTIHFLIHRIITHTVRWEHVIKYSFGVHFSMFHKSCVHQEAYILLWRL